MASPEPPGDGAREDLAGGAGGAEETVDAPIAPVRRPRLPVERLDLPVYRPRSARRPGPRFWLAVLAGVLVGLVVVLVVLA